MFETKTAATVGTATLLTLVGMEISDSRGRRHPDDLVADHRTAELFAAAMALAIGASAISLLRPSAPPLPRGRHRYFTGIALTWLGIAINRWAKGALGDEHRPLVTVPHGQHLVRGGPYRFVRHPMYLGSILICVGIGLATGTRPTLAIWTAGPPAALLQRIRVEEQVLSQHLEGYSDFQRTRSPLVPKLRVLFGAA